MKHVLSSKQVAQAIQVSESSVKRWCDKGVIPTQYTAGGHRRIALSGLIQFLRTSKCELAHPEMLGFPSKTGQSPRDLKQARDQLVSALIVGDEPVCRRIALDMYLAEHAFSVICDEVFAAAFRALGDRWACGDAEIYQERRGCQITMRLLHELRSLLPLPSESAPAAIGGSPPGDQYSLATTMAEIVLRDRRWNAESLGQNLPFSTMAAAIREHRPRMFWLSCSFIQYESVFLSGYRALFEEFSPNVAFAIGGHALNDSLRRRMKYSVFCDNMQQLEGFAITLRDSIGP